MTCPDCAGTGNVRVCDAHLKADCACFSGRSLVLCPNGCPVESKPKLLVGARVKIIEAGPFFGRTGTVARPVVVKHPTWRLVELDATTDWPAAEAVCPVEMLAELPAEGERHAG